MMNAQRLPSRRWAFIDMRVHSQFGLIGVSLCLFAVVLELSARFDKPRRLVLVAGSARAKLSTVGPWVLSSNVGSRTRQG
jgi:hypothetical protein